MSDLLERLAIPIPTVTTPQMFAYRLMERARADRRRIVLPEGDDDRILLCRPDCCSSAWPS